MKKLFLIFVLAIIVISCTEPEPEPAFIEVSSIKLSSTSINLQAGESVNLAATISPENATNKTVSWSSADSSIATVSKGKVTAVAVGSTTITARNGKVSATCRVTVNPTNATSIQLNQSSVSLCIGETITLTATISPETTTDKTIKWSSSDKSIASVDNTGKITAIAIGSTTITAQVGNIKASCAVAVKPIEVTSIELNQTSASITIGESINLTATVYPENATDKTITWSSSKTSVATVVGGKVTAIAEGNATITAQIGNIKAQCLITVNPVEVSSITLSQTSITLFAGETTNLTATIAPENATNKTITWSSLDSNIAAVNKDGIVTAITVGSTSIVAQAGKITASCTVTVKPIEVTSITLNHSDATIFKGENISLIATIVPANATNKTVTWASTDSDIATVNSDGVVTGVEAGIAQISANIDDAWAYCTISVLPSSLSFNQSNITMNIGDYKDLMSCIVPNIIPQSALTWVSSNPKVVSVSNNGVLSALQKGESIITAQLSNGVSATCHIIVINNPNAGGSEGTGEVEW